MSIDKVCIRVGDRVRKQHETTLKQCNGVCVFVWLTSIQCAKIYMILWPDRNSKMWPSAAYKPAIASHQESCMHIIYAVYITDNQNYIAALLISTHKLVYILPM